MKDEDLTEFINTNSRLVFYSLDWEDVFDRVEVIKDKCGSFNPNAMGNLQTLNGKTGQWQSSSIIKTGEQWRLCFYVPHDAEIQKPMQYNEALIAHEVWEMNHLSAVGKKIQGRMFLLRVGYALLLMFLLLDIAVYFLIRSVTCGN